MSTDIEWSPTAVKPNIDILDTQLNFADLPLIFRPNQFAEKRIES